MATAPKTQYESVADGYASFDTLPFGKLENELVTKALSDCTDLTVLDVGGGNGQYARKAIELGAQLVDVLDISPSMLALGIEKEEKMGREGKIRWFEADATKSLHHLPLIPGGYDIVMCNWVFDHATNEERELESMWRNASTLLKPGGKLVNVRATGPFDIDYAVSGQYGISLSHLTPIPGGIRYQVHCHIKQPFEFEGTTLDANARLSNEINHRNGLGDLEVLKPEETQVVKGNEAFWEDFVKQPYFAVLTAKKP